MAKNEKTSKPVATKAAKLLKKPSSPKDVKSVAGSALTQSKTKRKSNQLEITSLFLIQTNGIVITPFACSIVLSVSSAIELAIDITCSFSKMTKPTV